MCERERVSKGEGRRTAVVQDSVQTLTPLSSLLRSRPAHKIPQFSQKASAKPVQSIPTVNKYKLKHRF